MKRTYITMLLAAVVALSVSAAAPNDSVQYMKRNLEIANKM